MISHTLVIILTLLLLWLFCSWSSSGEVASSISMAFHSFLSSALSSSFFLSSIIYSSWTMALQLSSTGILYSCASREFLYSLSASLFSPCTVSRSCANLLFL